MGAPTYADDMALVAASPWELQTLINLVYSYSYKWRYSINSNKSHVLIFTQRHALPPAFRWVLGENEIPITSSAKHLGILLTSSTSSTITRTNNSITSSRSAFYALSVVGARHTGINTCTSLHLFNSISLAILSFGLEVWAPTKTELLMMERSQLRILRTILGVPSHVSSLEIHFLSGTLSVSQLVIQKQARFVHSVMALPADAVSRSILIYRATQSSPPLSSLIHSFDSVLETLSLPSIPELSISLPPKKAWKALIKTLSFEELYDQIEFSSMPSLSDIARLPHASKYGRPAVIMHSFKKDLKLSRLSNLRIRLLLHATSLASHTCSFHPIGGLPRSPVCLLCSLGVCEDILHFLSECPRLHSIRDPWLRKLYNSPPPPHTLVDHVLGIVWFEDQESTL